MINRITEYNSMTRRVGSQKATERNADSAESIPAGSVLKTSSERALIRHGDSDNINEMKRPVFFPASRVEPRIQQ